MYVADHTDAIPESGLPQTDVGNARRFVSQHKGHLRYSKGIGWLIYDGRRWIPSDASAIECAKDTTRRIYKEALKESDDTKRSELIYWGLSSQMRARITNMIELAKSDPDIVVDSTVWDSDPLLLNAHNGTINLKTGVLLPHDSNDYITKMANAGYYPDMRGPQTYQWDQFLKRVMPDRTMREYLQRAAGYSATGQIGEHVLFLNHGSGANGKSKFAEAIAHALGGYAHFAPVDLLMASKDDSHPTALADLRGVRFAITSETPDGRLAESRVKALTGGDTIAARRLYKDYVTFEPTHHLWVHTNNRPQVYGTDEGIWRRLQLIKWGVRIPDDEMDIRLGEKMRREADGILRWIVEGCLMWQQDGLTPPAYVTDATATYRTDSDILGMFLDECLIESTDSRESKTSIYKQYRQWCENNGHHPYSQVNLSRRLKDRGWSEIKSSGNMFWVGVELIPWYGADVESVA